MQQRRSFRKQLPLDQRLGEQAKRLRKEAQGTPPGVERDNLIRLAMQAETAAQMDEWLSPPPTHVDAGISRLRCRLRRSFHQCGCTRGDDAEAVEPCGTSAAAFVVAIENGREFDAVLIGLEGAAGAIINHGSLPASRITVRFSGAFVRLPVARLKAAKGRSRALAGLFARYADCLLA
jgi:hypothetical protein